MPRRLASFSIVLATVSASSVLSATSSFAGVSSAEMCFGQVPTIVGSPGQSVEGTEGPDVVITNGAYAGDTLGGDDLLCVTEVVEYGADYGFATGTGRDRIDATEAVGGYFSLGAGPDEFIGSDDGFDTVYADDASPTDPDADIVTTGDASDTVHSSGADIVDLGAWQDELWIDGDVSGGTYTGGAGSDNFTLDTVRTHDDPGSWTINSRTGRLLQDGQPRGQFRGFNTFSAAVVGSVTFIGSDAHQTFEPRFGWLARKAQVDVHMGGGNDRVYFRGGVPGGRFDGGSGADQFWYYRNDSQRLAPHVSVYFDLSTGLLRETWRDGMMARRAVRFENTAVYNGGGPVTLKGTSGPNRLKAMRSLPRYPVTLFGRGGADQLFGSVGNDLLLGGRGRDVAAGKSGNDRCDAEIRINCES